MVDVVVCVVKCESRDSFGSSQIEDTMVILKWGKQSLKRV